MMTDIEIARSIKLKNINDIAKQIKVDTEQIYNYGKHIAKIPVSLIDDQRIKNSNLVLVTAITPTKAGIGKTTTSIGLALGLNKIGKNVIVALREPSLGPCFGMKGGAAGGGYAQVLPMESINLHFTGDFHAITSAHNMITALLDNYLYRNNGTDKYLKEVAWKRVLDVNDRNLRYVVTGLNGSSNGITSETGFEITPASEIMAILCLAKDLDDLKRRIGNIILGYTSKGDAFTVNDLGVAGAIAVLLKDAINPNLVQTTEHSAAIIHGGPFANIAHGCNSVIATKMAMSHADYVITEAGFGADLGAEKFFNIKCRKAGISPKLTVIVVTTQALKMHGNVAVENIKEKNSEGIRRGFANLDKHIENMKSFGQSVVVALNKYNFDSDDELEIIRTHCREMGVGFALNESFAKGGEGAVELAEEVAKWINEKPSGTLHMTYSDTDSIEEKINKVAKQIYGAGSVILSSKAQKNLSRIRKLGLEHYPVCIAKTQYSFSDNAHAYGTPSGFKFTINDLVINNGAEFIVAIAGDIMRMPGLPAEPQAKHIDIVDGFIEGLS
jgi:formate--tetrahydrofolate ligase